MRRLAESGDILSDILSVIIGGLITIVLYILCVNHNPILDGNLMIACGFGLLSLVISGIIRYLIGNKD